MVVAQYQHIVYRCSECTVAWLVFSQSEKNIFTYKVPKKKALNHNKNFLVRAKTKIWDTFCVTLIFLNVFFFQKFEIFLDV